MLFLSYLLPRGEQAAWEPNVQIQAKLIMNVLLEESPVSDIQYAKKKHTAAN